MARQPNICCVRLDPNDLPKIIECADPFAIFGDAVGSRPFNEAGTQHVLFHRDVEKRKLKPNIIHPLGGDEIRGTIVVAGCNPDGNICSLSESEAKAVRARLKKRAKTMQITYSR